MSKLREERIKHGYTLKQIGSMIGVSEASVSLYETGKREPSNDTLKFLADLYGVTVDYLLGREENPLMDFYFETIPKTLILDGQPMRGLTDDRPETQMIAAEMMAKTLGCGATKEEVVDFNNLFFQLLPEERRIFISSMKALNLQRNKEGKT